MHKWRMQETTRARRCRYIPGRVPVEYDRPGMATLWLWITLWKDGSTGVGMGRCRYEIGPKLYTVYSFPPFVLYNIYIYII